MTELTIGRLATAAGVNVETVRYYQRRRLMTEPERPMNGQRRYGIDAVKRVRFIKRAQGLGLTLDEIGSLLDLDESRACAETRELAAHGVTSVCVLLVAVTPSGKPGPTGLGAAL